MRNAHAVCTTVDTPNQPQRQSNQQRRNMYDVYVSPTGTFYFVRRPNYAALAEQLRSPTSGNATGPRGPRRSRSSLTIPGLVRATATSRPSAPVLTTGRSRVGGEVRATHGSLDEAFGSPAPASAQSQRQRQVRRQGSTMSASSDLSVVQERSRRSRATRWPTSTSRQASDFAGPSWGRGEDEDGNSEAPAPRHDDDTSPEVSQPSTFRERLRRQGSRASRRARSTASNLKRRGSTWSLRSQRPARSLRSRRSNFSLSSAGTRHTFSTARASTANKLRRTGTWVRERFPRSSTQTQGQQANGGNEQVYSSQASEDNNTPNAVAPNDPENATDEQPNHCRRLSRRFSTFMQPAASSRHTRARGAEGEEHDTDVHRVEHAAEDLGGIDVSF